MAASRSFAVLAAVLLAMVAVPGALAVNVTFTNKWFASTTCNGTPDYIFFSPGCTLAAACTPTGATDSASFTCSQTGVAIPTQSTYAYVQAFASTTCDGTPTFQAAFKLNSCVFVEGPNIAYKYTACSGTNIVAQACVNAQNDCASNCTTRTSTGACAFTSGAYSTAVCYSSAASAALTPVLAGVAAAFAVLVVMASNFV